MTYIHGTCVAMEGKGVLLRGPSCSGKSDMALRLIDQGATLVADDQTVICMDSKRACVMLSPPVELAGLLEVRGLGILKVDYHPEAPLHLIVNLVATEELLRFPPIKTCHDFGLPVEQVDLSPFEGSAPNKIRAALACACGDIVRLSEKAVCS